MSKHKYEHKRFFVRKRISQAYHGTDNVLGHLLDAIQELKPDHPDLAKQLEEIAIGYSMLQETLYDYTQNALGENPEGLKKWWRL